MDLFDRKLSCNGTARPRFYVGDDEGLLNFDLLLREFEYAVFVDLIADLAEEVGDLTAAAPAADPGSAFVDCCSLAIIRRQQ